MEAEALRITFMRVPIDTFRRMITGVYIYHQFNLKVVIRRETLRQMSDYEVSIQRLSNRTSRFAAQLSPPHLLPMESRRTRKLNVVVSEAVSNRF